MRISDPFGISDPFNKRDESPRKSSEEIFQKPKGGGGGSAKKASEIKAREENDRVFEDHYKTLEAVKEPEPPPKAKVILSKPLWGGEQGIFGTKIKVSIEGSIPVEIQHRTKVSFTVYALPPNGERERIVSKEEHIRNGRAEVEIDLWQPAAKGPEGESLATCPYVFVAKHSCSDEVTSGKLDVSGKAFSLNDLREILLSLEKDKGPDAARFFVGSLNYNAVCELALKGMAENDPNKMPTRFFLLPGADASKLESTDTHAEEKSHPVSLANFRKALNALGFECASDGPFDEDLQSAFIKYLQSRGPRKRSEAVVHKVQKGETLGRIATQYGLPSWRTLYAFNEASIGSDPGLIKVGAELRLPDSVMARGGSTDSPKGRRPG